MRKAKPSHASCAALGAASPLLPLATHTAPTHLHIDPNEIVAPPAVHFLFLPLPAASAVAVCCAGGLAVEEDHIQTVGGAVVGGGRRLLLLLLLAVGGCYQRRARQRRVRPSCRRCCCWRGGEGRRARLLLLLLPLLLLARRCCRTAGAGSWLAGWQLDRCRCPCLHLLGTHRCCCCCYAPAVPRRLLARCVDTAGRTQRRLAVEERGGPASSGARHRCSRLRQQPNPLLLLLLLAVALLRLALLRPAAFCLPCTACRQRRRQLCFLSRRPLCCCPVGRCGGRRLQQAEPSAAAAARIAACNRRRLGRGGRTALKLLARTCLLAVRRRQQAIELAQRLGIALPGVGLLPVGLLLPDARADARRRCLCSRPAVHLALLGAVIFIANNGLFERAGRAASRSGPGSQLPSGALLLAVADHAIHGGHGEPIRLAALGELRWLARAARVCFPRPKLMHSARGN